MKIALYELFRSVLTIHYCGWCSYYHPHLRGEETGATRLSPGWQRGKPGFEPRPHCMSSFPEHATRRWCRCPWKQTCEGNLSAVCLAGISGGGQGWRKELGQEGNPHRWPSQAGHLGGQLEPICLGTSGRRVADASLESHMGSKKQGRLPIRPLSEVSS